jgi:hypothetical protein
VLPVLIGGGRLCGWEQGSGERGILVAMRVIYTLLFIVCLASCSGQPKPISGDSLGKYSYQVFTIQTKNGMIDFGTSFFIKKNDELFLITAKHVFVDCDSASNTEKIKFGNIFVHIPKSPQQMVPISFSRPAVSRLCLPVDKDTDVVVIKMDNQLIPYVNTVEDFIKPPFEKLGDAEIYGQGFKADTSSFYFTDPHHIHMPAKTFSVLQMIGDNETKLIDSIDYFFLTKILKTGGWMKGYSGAPVFLQDYKTKQWRLAGVFIGAEILVLNCKKPSDALIAVKPNYILAIINASKFGIR